MIARRVAAVDIGTNTVRLLVADARPQGLPGHGPLIDLDRRVDVVRLGEGVDRTGRLSPAAIARTIAVLETYGEALASWRPDRVKVVATSASRDASNREEFLEAVRLAVGVSPVVISGEREASLAFAGVITANDPGPSTTVIDLGGGSTEFVFGRDSVEHAVSIDIGSVRLTERILGEGPHPAERCDAARAHVDELLGDADLPEMSDRIFGVAGTFTSLAALALELDTYDSELVDGAELTAEQLRELSESLSAMDTKEIASRGAIDPRRAGVLTAGSIVAERSLAATGHDRLRVSEADLLDGIALWAAGLID